MNALGLMGGGLARSPGAFATRWRTRVFRLSFATVAVCGDVYEMKSAELSGQEKVPVITDGHKVVYDSWNIAVHLEGSLPTQPSVLGR